MSYIKVQDNFSGEPSYVLGLSKGFNDSTLDSENLIDISKKQNLAERSNHKNSLLLYQNQVNRK